MKRILCLCITILFVLSCMAAAFADSRNLPSINRSLRSGGKTRVEVGDTLDGYYPLNDQFSDIDYDVKILILEREAPKKEFTSRKVYPPFSSDDGFEDGFEGVDIGETRMWLRADLMAQLPSNLRAGSLEEATYLIICDTLYELDGTISVSDFTNNGEEELPEFESAEEMAQYFAEHPKEIESVTYYPKFGAYEIISLYETATKRASLVDYTYIQSMRFARNPEASQKWDDMGYLSDLAAALDEDAGVDADAARKAIDAIDFVSQKKKDSWTNYIDSEWYSTARNSVLSYYWSMAAELRELDPSDKNRAYYDLILRDENMNALSLFVAYCDYSGFDRSISSIEESGDYIASPDYNWIEENLQETVNRINQ